MTIENAFSTKAFLQFPECSIIPHLLLPTANVFALASPPFKGRGLLWSSLIAYLAYLSLADKYPSNIQVRYGLSCIWFFYLSTIEKLLFSQPEKSYWRLGRPRAEAESMPFGFQKLQWAAALWINPRGIGWNYQIKGLRPADNSSSRWWFVLRQLLWFLLFYVVVVFTIVYLTKHSYLREPDSTTWMRCVITELDTAIMIAFSWQMQWTLASIFGVASGLSQPGDWPPLFGRLGEVTSIRLFWGSFWHQVLRKTLSGFSHALINVLSIRHGSHLSYVIDLSVAFFLSGFFHAITLIPLPSSPPAYYTFRGILYFFMSQVVAIIAEELVIACYKRFAEPTGEQTEKGSQAKSVVWKTLVSYAWVIGWLLFSGGWAADIYLRMNMWEIPKLLVEPFLRFPAEYSPQGRFSVGGWLGTFNSWVDGH